MACSKPVDLPHLGPVVFETGGKIYHYPSFSRRYDGEKLHYDVFRILT